jgi:hypothetical protein
MAAGEVAAAIPLYADLVARVPGMSFPVSSLLRAYAFEQNWSAVDRLLQIAEQRQIRESGDDLPFIRAKCDPSAANIGAWRDTVAAQVRDTGCTDLSRLVYTARLGLVDEAVRFAEQARLGPTGSSADGLGPDGYRMSLVSAIGSRTPY